MMTRFALHLADFCGPIPPRRRPVPLPTAGPRRVRYLARILLPLLLGAAAPLTAMTAQALPREAAAQEIVPGGANHTVIVANADGVGYSLADLSQDLTIYPRLDLFAANEGNPLQFLREFIAWRVSRRLATLVDDPGRLPAADLQQKLDRYLGDSPPVFGSAFESPEAFGKQSEERLALHRLARQLLPQAKELVQREDAPAVDISADIELSVLYLPVPPESQPPIITKLLPALERMTAGAINRTEFERIATADVQGAQRFPLRQVAIDTFTPSFRAALEAAKTGNFVAPVIDRRGIYLALIERKRPISEAQSCNIRNGIKSRRLREKVRSLVDERLRELLRSKNFVFDEANLDLALKLIVDTSGDEPAVVTTGP